MGTAMYILNFALCSTKVLILHHDTYFIQTTVLLGARVFMQLKANT